MGFRSDREIWDVEFGMDGEERAEEIPGGRLGAFAMDQDVPCQYNL
jgi:hypothetical protein